MNHILVEVFICIAFILLCYHCCAKEDRDREGYDDAPDGNSNVDHEDLRRFRERLSERGGLAAAAPDGDNGARSTAARKELIENNLFSRKIRREESVKELSRLLAISRGGVEDEELGECALGAAPTMTTDASSSESSLPTPSAPPSSSTAAAATTTDTIATAISSLPQSSLATDTNIQQKLNPIALEPIRNLWSNLAHNIQTGSQRSIERSERPLAAQTKAASPVKRSSSILNTSHKLECSICLDQYSPNDTICWAKDGGDPPTLSSASVSLNNEMGCDHIFHKECILAWLQDHDECPLCRRKVVHIDADVRFAGWEMR